MQINELSGDERFLFENIPCRRTDKGEILSTVGQIALYGLKNFLFKSRENSFVFEITDSAQAKKISDTLRRKFIGVVYISDTVKDSEEKFLFCLRIVFFTRLVRFGKFQVIIGNKVKSTFKKHGLEAENYDALQNIFMFSDGVTDENCFAFLTAENAPDSEVEEEISGTENNSEVEEEISDTENDSEVEENHFVTSKKVLQIQGNECRLFVRLEGEGQNFRAVAYRVVFDKNKNVNQQMTLQLAYGNIEFSDEKSFVAARVKEILQETPNYISIWNEYANHEGDFLLEKARAVGTISYLPNFNHTDKGVEITVTDETACDLSYISAGDRLEMRVEDEFPPYYIVDTKMTWQDYQQKKEEVLAILNSPDENDNRPRTKSKLPKYPSFEVTAVGEKTLTLKGEKDLSTQGKLFFSIYGDEKQIETRTEARRRIENGKSAAPNLGLILGGRTEISAQSLGLTSENKVHINPRTQLLNEKIFRNEPTINQIQAIDIALNTPDIAVIQGPPGTGKTTVITAILERLNELSDKNNLQAGQVLITSLQHDAVQNVIERITINSLPTIKFGKREHDENQDFEMAMTNWCEKTLNELEKKYPQLRQTDKEKKLSELISLYILSPSNAKALNFLRAARLEVREESLLEKIDEVIADLQPTKFSSENNLLQKIYRIPTKTESFADGGQEFLIDLLNDLESLFGEKPTGTQTKILNTIKTACLADSWDEKILNDLKICRQKLLEKVIPAPVFDSEEIREDVTEIYQAVKNFLQLPENEIDNAVYELYRTLRDNPQSVKSAISTYSFAFAATAQQSDRKEIKLAKNVDNPYDDSTHAEYDTVIVDEAARITPGDLMIPLSQASRRIILVGDQRQLPHIYDEEIFQALRNEGKLKDESDIKVSMFEHLWNRAKALEKSDGIKRTITLDAQFRMHPMLGNFVSDNFYAPYGESFSSPRPATDFVQNISPSPVRWINLSTNRGRHIRTSSRSLMRLCEVDVIAETLEKYLAAPENENLTFGVISFYRAQAQAVKKKLKNFGSRVRIGTVDEFQGMEFDVMFLSVVRTAKNNFDFNEIDFETLKSDDAERQKIGGSVYGFLTDNRLCVALSRQKKLLIVVGDSEIFTGENYSRLAEICVPAMYNLYKLCEAEGCIVNG